MCRDLGVETTELMQLRAGVRWEKSPFDDGLAGWQQLLHFQFVVARSLRTLSDSSFHLIFLMDLLESSFLCSNTSGHGTNSKGIRTTNQDERDCFHSGGSSIYATSEQPCRLLLPLRQQLLPLLSNFQSLLPPES